jgi:hypothetical protein
LIESRPVRNQDDGYEVLGRCVFPEFAEGRVERRFASAYAKLERAVSLTLVDQSEDLLRVECVILRLLSL